MRPSGIWPRWHQTRRCDSWFTIFEYACMNFSVFLTQHVCITLEKSLFGVWKHFWDDCFSSQSLSVLWFDFLDYLFCYINVIFLDGLSVMRRGLSIWRPSFRTTRKTWPLRTLLPRSSRLRPATGQREVRHCFHFIFLSYFLLLMAIYFTILFCMCVFTIWIKTIDP